MLDLTAADVRPFQVGRDAGAVGVIDVPAPPAPGHRPLRMPMPARPRRSARRTEAAAAGPATVRAGATSRRDRHGLAERSLRLHARDARPERVQALDESAVSTLDGFEWFHAALPAGRQRGRDERHPRADVPAVERSCP